jgi:hypothetical protein
LLGEPVTRSKPQYTMSSAEEADSKDGNVKMVRQIAALMPDQGIKASIFENHYPGGWAVRFALDHC